MNPLGELPPVELHHASILFSDIPGFPGLAARLGGQPDLLAGMLSEHLDSAVRTIQRCGGNVQKLLERGVYATFEATDDQGSSPARAVAAAIELIRVNRSVNQRRIPDRRSRLEIGVGISTGQVVSGPERAGERTVVGSPVRVASRLVGQAHPAEVLLCSETYRGVRSLVGFQLIGTIAMRGRVGPIDIYSLDLSRQPLDLDSDSTN